MGVGRDPAPSSAERSRGGLPPLLLLTDRHASDGQGRGIVETVELAIVAGARAVVLREKDLPRGDRLALARQLRPLVPLLIVASDAELAREARADGAHLAASDPWPDRTSRQRGDDGADPFIVGRSCHGRAEVGRAAGEGATYATLSPVFPSASKPGYGPALGPGALGGHPIPVLGLGGIETGSAGDCLAAGASGVAVMGAVMGAADPARVVASLLDEIAGASTAERLGADPPTDRWVPTGRFGRADTHRSTGGGPR